MTDVEATGEQLDDDPGGTLQVSKRERARLLAACVRASPTEPHASSWWLDALDEMLDETSLAPAERGSIAAQIARRRARNGADEDTA